MSNLMSFLVNGWQRGTKTQMMLTATRDRSWGVPYQRSCKISV